MGSNEARADSITRHSLKEGRAEQQVEFGEKRSGKERRDALPEVTNKQTQKQRENEITKAKRREDELTTRLDLGYRAGHSNSNSNCSSSRRRAVVTLQV